MRRGIAIGGMMLAAVIGGAAATAVLGDQDAPAAPGTSTSTAPPPVDFAAADQVVDDACAVVVDVHDRAVRSALDAHERGTYVSIPSAGDVLADAEAIRLRRAALAAQVAVGEDTTQWPAVDAITLLAVAAQYHPDEVIVGELMAGEGLIPGTSIAVDDAFQRSLAACAER